MLKNVKMFPGEDASDLVRRYIKQESPITAASEDRFISIKEKTCSKASKTHMSLAISLLLPVVCHFMW